MPRLLAHLTVPCKGLIGPWAHGWPLMGAPGPAIGFLQEVLRWWDHWLKGVETGIMDEPRYRVWMQQAIPRTAGREEQPGRWVAESRWPSPAIVPQRQHLNPGRLAAAAEAEIAQLSESFDMNMTTDFCQIESVIQRQIDTNRGKTRVAVDMSSKGVAEIKAEEAVDKAMAEDLLTKFEQQLGLKSPETSPITESAKSLGPVTERQ